MGFVPIEQVAELLASVDVGVVPKRNDSFGGEAFSTKIMEFMAMGVPVIASRTRIDQYYFNPDVIQFFEPGSAQDLAEQVYKLASNPGLRQRLRTQAASFVSCNSWDVKKHEYLDLVDRLVRRQAPAGQTHRAVNTG
jgi:glycosyltransferase involved in cell wall biosynthesis